MYTKASENANQLESKITKLNCGLTYEEIVKIAIMTANEVKKNTPMYIGDINPKWQLWDNTLKELNMRIKV